MAQSLKLSVFNPDGPDPVSTQAAEQQQTQEAWQLGYDAGFAAGAAASAEEHANEQAQLRARFVEALRDQQISRASAQTSVLQGFFPLLERIIAQLAPALAKSGLPSHVAARLDHALNERPDLMPVLHCAPEALSGVEAALSDWSGRYRAVADPRLTPTEAQLHWDDGFDHVDLDTTIAAIRTELDDLSRTIERNTEEEALSNAG